MNSISVSEQTERRLQSTAFSGVELISVCLDVTDKMAEDITTKLSR